MTEDKTIDVLNNVLIVNAQLEKPAIEKATRALRLIGHLKDRPCEVCEFHGENGCCKWSCVFDEVWRKEE